MEAGDMRSMHEFTDETAWLSDAIEAHTRGRIAHDQPLDGASTPDELTAEAGDTITPDGIGGKEALRIWADVLAPSTLSTDHPAFVAFVSGGAAGNLSALAAARHAAAIVRGGKPAGGWRVAAAQSAHSSVASAARVMDVDVERLPVDERDRLHGDAVRQALAGRDDVFAVVASAGSTNAGVVDDLDGVAAACDNAGVWLHVDGAYGGAAL